MTRRKLLASLAACVGLSVIPKTALSRATVLDWRGPNWPKSTPSHIGPGRGDVYVNGRKVINQGFHYILTVCGFGYGLYDVMDGMEPVIAGPLLPGKRYIKQGRSFGFIRFVPHADSPCIPAIA